MGKSFICPSESIAIFQYFKAGRLVPGGRYVPQKNRVSILLPVSARERAKPDTAKVNGKTFICPSESMAIIQHLKRWLTCSRRALRPAKNRFSILLPVSARERAKPDKAKVNGIFNVKNNHLPLKEFEHS